MSEDMGDGVGESTYESTRVNNAPALIKALQTSGALTLQQEAQLQVAFSKAGDTPPEETFSGTGIFTAKQSAGLAKTLHLMDQNRITLMEVATCMATMLSTFSTLDEALTEIEFTALPEGQEVSG